MKLKVIKLGMLSKYGLPFFMGMILMVTGCQKDKGLDCFKSTGKIVIEERSVGIVNVIELHDNINLILTHDTLKTRLAVEAGENLLYKITTGIDSNKLILRNNNNCNWVRSFETPVNVYLTASRIDTIIYHASGDISTTNALVNDTLQVDIWEGSGSINMNINVSRSRFYVHTGTVDLTVRGSSQINFIASLAYGPVNCLDLETKFTYMRTISPNDCYVNATVTLSVEILNIGNIYYKGNPPNVSGSISGSGKLIKLD